MEVRPDLVRSLEVSWRSDCGPLCHLGLERFFTCLAASLLTQISLSLNFCPLLSQTEPADQLRYAGHLLGLLTTSLNSLTVKVEVEREGEEKQILRLHHRARISTLQLLNPTPLPDLQSTGEKNCLLASGSEDGLVKIWRVSSNGWSQMGAFQCKGPAVTKVVGYEAAMGGGTTIGRVVVADAAGQIYCIKGWP